jgi:hypothetical protein
VGLEPFEEPPSDEPDELDELDESEEADEDDEDFESLDSLSFFGRPADLDPLRESVL